ncbi:MAG TPA: MbtH family NRPS accessory protein [Chloroflexota bacterium]|nr:MbtH family NRPS accessory protein [Chloroflexota bacterium]
MEGARGAPGHWLLLVNDEGQFSVWQAEHEAPAGWHQTGCTGTREACMAFADTMWLDMRPRRLRLLHGDQESPRGTGDCNLG